MPRVCAVFESMKVLVFILAVIVLIESLRYLPSATDVFGFRLYFVSVLRPDKTFIPLPEAWPFVGVSLTLRV